MFNHPELKWQVIETEHFRIMADKDLIDVAKDIAQVAEEIFPRVTRDLGYVPNFKIPLVVIDYSEEFNGSADPLFGKMTIYCSSGTKVTSGNLPWFRRVVAHEFSHIISFGAIGAFEGMNQRYQVLGALQVIPMWFLEGIAQWEGETWDTHRDMFLRMTVLGNRLLPLSKMDGFAGSDVRESRLVYEQGHSLVRFIAAKYGRDKIRKLLAELRKSPFSLGAAFKKVTRKEFPVIYGQWLEQINSVYTEKKNETKPYYGSAARLTDIGGWMYHPVFSPDGAKILYSSSFDYDDATCDLFIAGLKGNSLKGRKKIAERTGYFHSFSPDGKKILYSKIDYRKHGSYTEDIYMADISGREAPRRLTFNERAKHPSFSPDGKKIAFVVNNRGVTDIWLMDADGKNKTNLTEGRDYEQNDSPRWSSDGRFLVFSRFSAQNRDIAVIDFASQKIDNLTDDEWDDRTPVFLPDGSGLLFTSDRGTGIPNLFLMKFEDAGSEGLRQKEMIRLTNVTGGIFEPCVDQSGKRIVFSGFGSKGFDLYLCELGRLAEYRTPETDYYDLQRARNRMYVPLREEGALVSLSDETVTYDSAPCFTGGFTGQDTPVVEKAVYSGPEPEFPEEELAVPANVHPSQPSSYNSFTEIRPMFVLPAVVISSDGQSLQGWGTIDFYFLDPLEKNTIMGSAYFNGVDAVYSWNYINKILYPTIYLSGYQNSYSWAGGYSWYRSKGTILQADFPIDGNRVITLAGVLGGQDDVTTDTAGNILPDLSVSRSDNSLGVLYRYFTAKERVDMSFNPGGGRSITFSYFWSDPALGSSYGYNLFGIDWREYLDVWRRGGQTAALRFYSRFMENTDRYRIGIPWDTNLLRGFAYGSVSGTRITAFSAEYRLPVAKDLKANILGMYFDRWYVVPFFDCGAGWYGNDFSNGTYLWSAGLEYRFQCWVMSRYAMLFRFGIATTDFTSNPAKGGFFFSVQPVF